MNLGGDGRDTWPFLGPVDAAYERTHYDLSKLHQWRLVLEHAQRRGIHLHFVLGEPEHPNEHWLDDGQLGIERRVFYRELAARFGDLLAVKWNLGEECNHAVPRLRDFATWLRAALKAGVSEVKFDRGGYLYHGRVKALAEGAREAGLKF